LSGPGCFSRKIHNSGEYDVVQDLESSHNTFLQPETSCFHAQELSIGDVAKVAATMARLGPLSRTGRAGPNEQHDFRFVKCNYEIEIEGSTMSTEIGTTIRTFGTQVRTFHQDFRNPGTDAISGRATRIDRFLTSSDDADDCCTHKCCCFCSADFQQWFRMKMGCWNPPQGLLYKKKTRILTLGVMLNSAGTLLGSLTSRLQVCPVFA
jgi:hypothetical protein